jgi:crotonobetainyl-CoA:carnitine CoA-transferase CaiB-like acyl-CoA transferase
MTKTPTGPLKGLRVFDLTRVLAGPTCAQMLADLGADVVKIERPGAGDDTRGFAPPVMPGTQESAYFVGVNRNKQSVTLDIGQQAGQEIALKLIESCDILVENFKVGALAKYGLGYEQLHTRFPRLIYCSITGFGQTGPYAPRPGYDSLIQAMGGVMSLTGEPDGLPQKVGVPVADLFAGLYGCIGILAALRHRDLTGQGQ